MNIFFVWMLVIGGSGDYFPPSIPNIMYADLPSCIAVRNSIKIPQGHYSYGNSQCVKVRVLVPTYPNRVRG